MTRKRRARAAVARGLEKLGHIRRPKEWEIIPNRARVEHIEVDDQKHAFGRRGFLKTKDPGKAREVHQRYGHDRRAPERGDALVIEVDPPRDDTHPCFVSVPAMPWHHYDENGKRIRDE